MHVRHKSTHHIRHKLLEVSLGPAGGRFTCSCIAATEKFSTSYTRGALLGQIDGCHGNRGTCSCCASHTHALKPQAASTTASMPVKNVRYRLCLLSLSLKVDCLAAQHWLHHADVTCFVIESNSVRCVCQHVRRSELCEISETPFQQWISVSRSVSKRAHVGIP